MAQLRRGSAPVSAVGRSTGGGGGGRGGAINVARRGGARSGGPSRLSTTAGAQRTNLKY